MFFKLLSIEWMRLSRRALLWVTLGVTTLYMSLALANFYKASRVELLDGTLKMPGMAFDLANALDQLTIVIPLLVIIVGNLMGNDYSQRTNQHWLRRAPRHSSLLAKFTILTALTFFIQVLTLVIGWAVGYYYKTYIYHVPDVNNVNWLATLAAPFYMTLVNLPYLALTLLITVVVRSTFFSIVLGLGYTQILEMMLAGIFYGKPWTKWLFTNLHFSASFLLNDIGSHIPKLPEHILAPAPALLAAALYTLAFMVLAVWFYRRQDVGG
ncbi:MAG TPA: ABC transporter permease [Anaerolineales bacterium]|nr:ABC transporter permease [Anaerolineales bacterium]